MILERIHVIICDIMPYVMYVHVFDLQFTVPDCHWHLEYGSKVFTPSQLQQQAPITATGTRRAKTCFFEFCCFCTLYNKTCLLGTQVFRYQKGSQQSTQQQHRTLECQHLVAPPRTQVYSRSKFGSENCCFFGGACPGNVAPNFLQLAAAALCTSTWQHLLYSPWGHSLKMLLPSILCSNCWWRFSVAGSVRRRNPRPKMCWVNSFFQLNCHVHILFAGQPIQFCIVYLQSILKSFLFELMFKNIPIHLYFPFCFQRIDPQYEYRQTSKLG